MNTPNGVAVASVYKPRKAQPLKMFVRRWLLDEIPPEPKELASTILKEVEGLIADCDPALLAHLPSDNASGGRPRIVRVGLLHKNREHFAFLRYAAHDGGFFLSKRDEKDYELIPEVVYSLTKGKWEGPFDRDHGWPGEEHRRRPVVHVLVEKLLLAAGYFPSAITMKC